MALAPKTVLTYPLNGTNRDFTIPFEYLARKFVQVTLVGKDRTILTLNIDYRFTQRTIITTTKPWGPADGYERIEIRRYTSATERLVDFSDGSILRAYDLNTSQVQSLHIAEEGRDVASDTIGVNNGGDLDARGRKIVNLADAVSDGDAVTLRQEKAWGASTLKQANRSEQQANSSHASRIASDDAARRSGESAAQSLSSAQGSHQDAERSIAARKGSETARDKAKKWAEAGSGVQVEPGLYSAKAWALTSGDYAGQANSSKVAAANSASQSLKDADRSKAEANRAAAEAHKLGSANQFMGTIDSIQGNKVIFKGPHHIADALFIQREGSKLADNKYAYIGHYANGNFTLGNSPTGDLLTLSTGGNMGVAGAVIAGGALGVKARNNVDNAGLWFYTPEQAARGAIYCRTSGAIVMSPAYGLPGSPRLTVSFNTDGSVWTQAGIYLAADGKTKLAQDGNITSTIYLGGTLHYNLSRLRDAITTPRENKVTLWIAKPPSAPNWSIGATIVLNDDVRNYTSFTSHWDSTMSGRVCILTGLRELATYPFGTQIYMGAGNGVFYGVKFNDLGDGSYRSLTMVDAGNGAVALPVIYGFRKEV